jgi:transposase
MSKPRKQSRIKELTPELLQELDLETLVGLVMKLYEQNKQLSEQVQAFIHDRYAKKTERHENPEQLRLFDSGETEQPAPSTEPTQTQTTESKPSKPKKAGHSPNPMPSNLERKRRVRTPEEHELVCRCGGRRVCVNEVLRKSRYECIPASIFIEEIIDSIWECPNCQETVVIESDAFEPIENGKAGPHLLLQIAEDRWLNHLPLYRQEQKYARLGADIPRATSCGWMASLATIYSPVVDCMQTELLKSKIIALDDSPVKVQDRKKKQNIKRGYEWIMMGDDGHPINLFKYIQSRSRAGPKKILAGFKGYLQGDCYSGNLALCEEIGATMVACRAHDRRYYKKARANNKKLCDEMLDMQGELFEIERTAKELELSADQIRKLREEESVPLLAKIKNWIDEQTLGALPSSSFGKALIYSRNNWDRLNNYLLDGDLRIDNNLAEQQMKMFATGRKNWYFFGSDEGGEHASIMFSLFSTCLRNNVNPREYLLDVLQKLIENPDCDKFQLLPHIWKKNQAKREIEMSKMPQKV